MKKHETTVDINAQPSEYGTVMVDQELIILDSPLKGGKIKVRRWNGRRYISGTAYVVEAQVVRLG